MRVGVPIFSFCITNIFDAITNVCQTSVSSKKPLRNTNHRWETDMQIAGRESDAQTDRQDTEMQAETLGHAQIAGIDRERDRQARGQTRKRACMFVSNHESRLAIRHGRSK